jgi:hypothetical protein
MDGLLEVSPKFHMLLKNIMKAPGLILIYSHFRSLEGVQILSHILDYHGYARYNSSASTSKKTHYAIYSGREDDREKRETIRVMTSSENKHGEKIKILMISSAGAEGLDLKNIRQIHILEPYWNQIKIKQIIGRGVRRNSHIDLPPEERNVEIFRYFSVFSPRDRLLTRDKLSTDEYIENISMKKHIIIQQLTDILKECAFDCLLNKADIQESYPCYTFGRDARGISYYPEISMDMIQSSSTKETRKKSRTLQKAIYSGKQLYLIAQKDKYYLYSTKNNTKKSYITKEELLRQKMDKMVLLYVDTMTDEVFDRKSVETGENPIRLGFVHKSGAIVKKR